MGQGFLWNAAEGRELNARSEPQVERLACHHPAQLQASHFFMEPTSAGKAAAPSWDRPAGASDEEEAA
jgi:hypothetical protein